ncbi:MAG: non-homologous end-joining DNA ligase, partial [Bdellovibrio sp.]
MSLKEYHKKRDFRKTPEPTLSRKSQKEPLFVIQEHHASHLHYDFRLEAFGVLKSWAIPKGPSTTIGEKRLAVEVEDHPISYATFKGRIPKGEYGAGVVKIWDHGTWIPPQNIKQALAKGKLEFELKGKKLKGRWLLIRTQGGKGKKNQWLLFKRHDEKTPAKNLGVRSLLPTEIRPQLATLVTQPPEGEEWIHEIKLDGYRTLARLHSRRVQLLTRNALDWTEKYGSLAEDFKNLNVKNALIDGEIIVRDQKGRSHFDELQEALASGQTDKLEFCAFDLLYLNGRDLREESLETRKELLHEVLSSSPTPQISFSEHLPGTGNDILKKVCRDGSEGIISKDRSQPYQMTRTQTWLKSKCVQRQEFVVGGYTEPTGSREYLGALLLGVYEDGELRYVGRVGTGFNQKKLRDIQQKIKKMHSTKCPFHKATPSASRGVHWLRPRLIAEVEFRAWTSANILRQASFIALRSDKTSKEIIKETPQASPTTRITHPERVLYKNPSVTKLMVAQYYKTVAPW